MKADDNLQVLISDATYSYLTPGGKQVHAQNLLNALTRLGVDARYETWHDPNLRPNVVHFLGYADTRRIRLLHSIGVKLVLTQIMDWAANATGRKMLHARLKHTVCKLLPNRLEPLFPWRALKYFDAFTYMHEADRKTASMLYGIPDHKTFIIPHGVESLKTVTHSRTYDLPPELPSRYLVSVGSICPRKNSVFLAQVAKTAKVPVVFVGHTPPTAPDYAAAFRELLDSTFVFYYPDATEQLKSALAHNASGFALLSHGESGCIAVYEAASAGLPLLLSDLPWAHHYESPRHIDHCSASSLAQAAACLANFFSTAHRQASPTFTVHTWDTLGEMYLNVYRSVVETSPSPPVAHPATRA